VLMRSLHHEISGEHGAAANLVHTGRMPSGTILYPSIGSIVSQLTLVGGRIVYADGPFATYEDKARR